MKLIHDKKHSSRRAVVAADLSVGLALIAMVVIPLSYTWLKEQQVLRSQYYQAVAMQLVDGEMEILAAGEWRTLPEGTNTYAISHAAAKRLAPGRFLSVRTDRRIRLEWIPERRGLGRRVVREVEIQ
ncbi:MAG: hypothetical protein ACI9OD_003239 [Limisphaerales bacterium]|jgi:hypothetical protein